MKSGKISSSEQTPHHADLGPHPCSPLPPPLGISQINHSRDDKTPFSQWIWSGNCVSSWVWFLFMFLRREPPGWQLLGSLSGDTKMGITLFFSAPNNAAFPGPEGGTAFDQQSGVCPPQTQELRQEFVLLHPRKASGARQSSLTLCLQS